MAKRKRGSTTSRENKQQHRDWKTERALSVVPVPPAPRAHAQLPSTCPASSRSARCKGRGKRKEPSLPFRIGPADAQPCTARAASIGAADKNLAVSVAVATYNFTSSSD